MNACSLKTSPCTVFWGGKVENPGKVIKLEWIDKREWVCVGSMSSEAIVGFPVLSPLIFVATKTSKALSMCPGKLRDLWALGPIQVAVPKKMMLVDFS